MSQKNRSQLSELRLWSELFAVTTMFVVFSIILFSVQQDAPVQISFIIPHQLFFMMGCLSIIFAIGFLVLLFWNSKAKSLANWIENSDTHPKLRNAFWKIFWPLFWMGASLTFISALADTSKRLPNNWHPITFIAGSILYIVIAFNLITRGLLIRRGEMQDNKVGAGFLLRDAFEKELKGYKTWCGVCGKSGVIGDDLSIVYSETDVPSGRTYSVWAICEQCRKTYPETKKK